MPPHGASIRFSGRRAAFGTKHGKATLVAPSLEAGLGLTVTECPLDTDRFGTFTGEIARTGSAREAARAKAYAALAADPSSTLALASEGSFGPDPDLPWLARGIELLLLLDRATGHEVTGVDVTHATNHLQRRIGDHAELAAFAAQVGFPAHGVILLGGDAAGAPAPHLTCRRDLDTMADLEAAFAEMATKCTGVSAMSDMRAHRNPLRQRAISRAADSLLQNARSLCPACAAPGFVAVAVAAYAPRGVCGLASHVPQKDLWRCTWCGRSEESSRADAPPVADAAHCPSCNP